MQRRTQVSNAQNRSTGRAARRAEAAKVAEQGVTPNLKKLRKVMCVKRDEVQHLGFL